MQPHNTDRAIHHLHKAFIAGAVTLSISAPSVARPASCEVPPDQPLVVNAIENGEYCDNQVTLAEAVSFANEAMGLDTITFHQSLANTVIPANNIYVREGVTIQGHEDASSITLQATDRRIFNLGSGKQPKFLLKNLTLETETEITDPLIEFYGYGGELTLDNIRTTEQTQAGGIVHGDTSYQTGSDISLFIKNSYFYRSEFNRTAIRSLSFNPDLTTNINIENSVFKDINTHILASSESEKMLISDGSAYFGNSNISIEDTTIDGGTIGAGDFSDGYSMVKSHSDKHASLLVKNSTIKNINQDDNYQKYNLKNLFENSGIQGANLTIDSSIIQGNTADRLTSNYSSYGSALTEVLDSQISENSLYFSGFYTRKWDSQGEKSSSINILRSAIDRNMDAYGGDYRTALVHTREGSILVEDSVINSNTLKAITGTDPKIIDIQNTSITNNQSIYSGSGLYLYKYSSGPETSDLLISNSTFSHNSEHPDGFGSSGSAIVLETWGTKNHINANLSNVTITENSATGYGGGILVEDDNDEGEGITVNIDNSIIANNHTSGDSSIHTDRDLSGNFNVTSSLIGDTTTAGHTTINGVKISEANNENGNNLLGADAKLSPLQESASMLVHQLQADSPAIAAGKINPDNLPEFEQRGEGFPRVRETANGNELDLGAVQFFEIPVAVDDKQEVESNSKSNVIQVSSNDAKSSIDLALDLGSLTILQYPSHGEASANRDGSITYTPEAGFSGKDSLTYQIADVSGQYSNEATLNLNVVEPTENETDDEVDNNGGGPLNMIFLGILALLGLSHTRSKKK